MILKHFHLKMLEKGTGLPIRIAAFRGRSVVGNARGQSLEKIAPLI
jgi:hypothetical protein